MLVTVIICTIRRIELLRELLQNLANQSYRNIEVLVVGTDAWTSSPPSVQPDCDNLKVSFLGAPKGLSQARNVGLRHANGSLVCYLDDDVLLERDFFSKTVKFFSHPPFSNVGGITGYDTVHYKSPISLRWKLRYWLRVIPSLQPGDVDHLGSNVPLAFLAPFSGWREVRWLPGFCQIFQRRAIEGITFDEGTHAAEDRDFSMAVGKNWRLLVCGDLRLAHYQDSEDRMASVAGTRRAAFGLGRSCIKRNQGLRDYLTIAHIMLADFVIDVVAAIAKPSMTSWQMVLSRLQGYVSGILSFRRDLVRQEPIL